jgi:hypothetical protein
MPSKRPARTTVAKSRAKNEVHAALMRRLVSKPGFSDVFGKARTCPMTSDWRTTRTASRR